LNRDNDTAAAEKPIYTYRAHRIRLLVI
jgi:hypothetical protein